MTKRVERKTSGMRSLLAVFLAVIALVAAVALPGCESELVNEVVDTAAQLASEDEQTSAAQDTQDAQDAQEPSAAESTQAIDESGSYTSKEEVALYLHTYGHLPSNYITKDEAEDAGWKTEGLSLDEACPGMSIGGDRFGNREGLLPKASGRSYQECDIDYQGGNRNAKRIVYSNDGLIFYTEDHYQSFEQLY